MRVPAHVASGRRAPFPMGVFIGNLGEVTTAWSDDQKNLSMTLVLEENTPFDEESPNVGARTKMQRVALIWDGKALAEIEEFDESVPFPLQNAATLVTQLAVALGFTSYAADGTADFDTEAFLEALTAGTYKGATVVFEIRHRAYASREAKEAAKMTGKKKAENDRVDDSISHFQALDQNGEPQSEVAPTPQPPSKAAPAPVSRAPSAVLSGSRKR